MLHIGTIDIETKRVILRKFRLDDTTNMFNNWANSDLVTRYLSWNPYTEMKQCEEYIKKVINQYNEKSFYNWAIELKEIGEVIGSVSVNIQEKLSCAHISFCIGHKWWNQRIMQEIVTNLVPVFLEEIQVERLESCYESGNNTAGKVLLRAGFQAEAIQRKSYLGKEGASDMIWFSI